MALFPESLPTDACALDDLTRTRTWGELDERARRAAALFGELGLAPGDHAAMVVGNRVEFVELVLGALLAGVWLTPVNWHLAPDEIAHVLDDSGAGHLVVDPDHQQVALAAAGDRTVLELGPAFEDALAATRPMRVEEDRRPGGTMFYTSGTTGRPKGVKRTPQPTVGGQLDALRAAGRVLGLHGAGPHLVTGPLYHAAPVGFALMDLLQGAPMVVMPRWDERRALALVEGRAVVATHLVPTMFVRLLRLPADERAAADLSSLRCVLHGAAPIAPGVKERMIEWWGPVLVEYWGGSEGGVVTLVDSLDWSAIRGTVGRPTASHQVFAGTDEGEPLPAGETGLLWCRNLRADQVFTYHGDPDKTAAAHPEPGLYALGDVGRVDEDGYVYLSDRASHMIISGGVNIYPAEIEAVLVEHPAVADVVVFGVPDDEWGESVHAVVEPAAAGWSEDDTTSMLGWAREHLAGYKVPRTVEAVAQLPRQPNGKLHVRALRDPHWAGRERAI